MENEVVTTDIVGWTIGFSNETASLMMVPVRADVIKSSIGMEIIRRHSMFEVSKHCNHVIYLADEKTFPEMKNGFFEISPSIKIEDFMIKAKDAFAANMALDMLQKYRIRSQNPL